MSQGTVTSEVVLVLLCAGRAEETTHQPASNYLLVSLPQRLLSLPAQEHRDITKHLNTYLNACETSPAPVHGWVGGVLFPDPRVTGSVTGVCSRHRVSLSSYACISGLSLTTLDFSTC